MPMPQVDVSNVTFPITTVETCLLTLAAQFRIREAAMRTEDEKGQPLVPDLDRALVADRRIDNLLSLLSRLKAGESWTR